MLMKPYIELSGVGKVVPSGRGRGRVAMTGGKFHIGDQREEVL